ncbi:tetratricopeptide repeat protein [Rhodoferax antarcticus]|uniref:tetratricopeptide repeat protein n=1 Tax=Rhodoferax antarcticus TaxID=81479 RepID=UPI0022250996|nr:tetratricopeptide repeat protein [Rhodoferax antarcticus]MCW2314350.1 tetratricopeptide (TPR) repeat protein [Rhodoferax antarcticus]
MLHNNLRHLAPAVFFALIAMAVNAQTQNTPASVQPAAMGSAATESKPELQMKGLDEQAQAAWSAKDWQKVIDLYTQAIALDPKYAHGYRWRAYALLELEQYDLAITDAHKGLKLAPKDGNAYNGLCWTLILAGKATQAQSVCAKGQALDLINLAITANLAGTYLLQGNKDQTSRVRQLFAPRHLNPQ